MPTTCFPKTDLGRLLRLEPTIRSLAVLAAMRFVTLEDLASATAPTGTVREISTLVDRGLLARLLLQRRLTDPSAIEVLTLTRTGARELAAALEADPASVPWSTKTTARRSTMFLDHTLARNRLALMLARALGPKLLSWEHDADRLADSVASAGANITGRVALVADGLAVVHGPRGAEGLLVEIDRGTERAAYMARKYAGYLTWWREGGPRRRFDLKALRLVTVTPDEKRAARLREAAIGVTGRQAAGLFWFADEAALMRDGILAPVWSTLRAEHVPLWS